MSNKYLFCRYKNTMNVLIMRFDYIHALLVINLMLNLWFGTSFNHFFFRNRNFAILKYRDIPINHFNLKLNINPYGLNSGWKLSCQPSSHSLNLIHCFDYHQYSVMKRIIPLFSIQECEIFKKKMFSQHSAKSCYFVQFGCVFVGWPVFWLSPSCRCIDAEESAKTLNEQLDTICKR